MNPIQKPWTDVLAANWQNASQAVVLSDMSPNITGAYGMDHWRSMQLAKLAVDFGMPLLADGGHVVIKTFEGEDLPAFVRLLTSRFGRVKRFRPDASRKASSEGYVCAMGFDGRGPLEWGDFLSGNGDDEPEDED